MSDLSIFDDYSIRLGAKRTGERELKKAKMRTYLTSTFEADPAFYQCACVFPDGSLGTRRVKIIHRDFIVELNPDRNKSFYFHAHPDEELLEGTILLDLFGKDWMITASSNMNDILDRGMMQQVNYDLKWITDGVLYESPVVLSGVSRRSDGIDEKRTMILPEDSISITLPLNDKSITIKRDTRFIIHGAAFRTTKIDRYTSDELVGLIVVEDLHGPNDNMELGIADYTTLVTPQTPTGSTYILIYGSDTIRIGQTQQYTTKIVVNDIETSNPITFTVDKPDLVELTTVQNSLTMKAKNVIPNIGEKITLTATHNYIVATKIITIRGLT